MPVRPSSALTSRQPGGRPFRKGHPKLGGRKKGTTNVVTREMKDFLRSVVEDPDYQDSVRQRMIAGKAPHMEQLAAYYTLGKPREQVQVETNPSMAQLLTLAQKAVAAERREKLGHEEGASGQPRGSG